MLQKLPFFTIKQFSDAWESKAKEITNREFRSGADSFQELGTTTAAVDKNVRSACAEIGVSPHVVEWPELQDEFPSSVHEIMEVHKWLAKNGLVVKTSVTPPLEDKSGMTIAS